MGRGAADIGRRGEGGCPRYMGICWRDGGHDWLRASECRVCVCVCACVCVCVRMRARVRVANVHRVGAIDNLILYMYIY